MTMNRNAVLAAIIATGFVGTSLTTVHAQFEPTADDRAACDKDAFKLCASALPNKEAVMLCLKGKKNQLTPRWVLKLAAGLPVSSEQSRSANTRR